MKIYIAAPMFSEAELCFNEKITAELERYGFEVFLPQRSGYKMSELLKEVTADEARRIIFQTDYEAISSAEVVLVVLDGRVIDEGACIELGIGYMQGKECYGLKTDPRAMIEGQINPMISGCLQLVFSTVSDVINCLLLKQV